MTERRLTDSQPAPQGVPGCPHCDGQGIDLGAFHRFDIRVVCECVPGCPCAEPARVTCGNCERSWCERCDPAPSALCHWCHGRGHSLAELGR